jgi:hypothetical protein
LETAGPMENKDTLASSYITWLLKMSKTCVRTFDTSQIEIMFSLDANMIQKFLEMHRPSRTKRCILSSNMVLLSTTGVSTPNLGCAFIILFNSDELWCVWFWTNWFVTFI